MIKKLIFLLLIFYSTLTFAQTFKTDVLVIGSTPSGAAAAIQSARSKVKTVLTFSGATIVELSSGGMFSIPTNNEMQSGIWEEFSNHIRDIYKTKPGFDTSYNAPVHFNAEEELAVLTQIADTVKNLTVYPNMILSSLKKNGDGWDVSFNQNGKSIIVKTRVVIDATGKGEGVEKAGGKLPDAIKIDSESKLYRTTIAAVEAIPGRELFIPLTEIIARNSDNILGTAKALSANNNIQNLPLQLQLGQGVGATAAYCAFFKTTTKNLKSRIIQGELLDFKVYLLPFADISVKDPDWRQIQQVGASGMLKGHFSDNKFCFFPDESVLTAEIKPVLTEIYTRAFLWFDKDKPGENFTVNNVISLLSDYTLTDPSLMKDKLQKGWKTQFKFNLNFDPKRPITRREFAVLVNRYLNPFARTVDLDGRLIN